MNMNQTLALSLAAVFAVVSIVSAIKLPASCGHSAISGPQASSSWRIVGGKIAKLGEWPWQVYLNKTITYQGIEMLSDCGAAILSKDWLVTAGHCVFDYNQTSMGIQFNLEAVFGTVDLNQRSGSEIRRKVTKVLLHDKFSYENKANDIALLKLDHSLDFEGTEKHLQPVCLAKLSGEFFDNCFATGFGYQDGDMTSNDYKLRSLSETVLDHSKCNNRFLHYNQTFNLCIGGVEDHGTCKGDSGSPFVCHHKSENKWYQMGLVSYGIPCALKDVPDVLTRVSYFHDWILEQNA